MEVIAISLPLDDPVIRIRTDSLLVSKRNAVLTEDLFKRYTRHNDEAGGSGIPGKAVGYTKMAVTVEMLNTIGKYKDVLNKVATHSYELGGRFGGLTTGKQPPSNVKKALDTFKQTVIRNSELMHEFHIDEGLPLEELIGGSYTPSEFGTIVAMAATGPDPDARVNAFQKEFDKYEAEYLKGLGSIRIAGGPGTGKTHTVLNLVGAYKDESMFDDEQKTTISATPYHAITRSFTPHMTHASTMHSFMGCGLNISNVSRKPFRLLERSEASLKMHPYKPYKEPNCVTVFDETQSMAKSCEEGLKAANYLGGSTIISGDEFQLSSLGVDGVDLDGSVVKTISNNTLYIKDIEYRKKEPEYLIGKEKTRQGNALMYMDPSMCNYSDGDQGKEEMNKWFMEIASDLYTSGKTDVVIACQSYNVAGICVSTVIRLLLLLGKKPDHTLIHIGGQTQTTRAADNEEEEAELEIRHLYKQYGKDAHAQKLHGVPLVFYKGMRYIVTKGFSLHAPNHEVDKNLHQTQVLDFVSAEKTNVVLKLAGKKPMDECILLLNFTTKDEHNTVKKVVLTEFEATSYLMYPFVAQRIGLIGLTLNKVVSLQVAIPKTWADGYVRSYVPMKDTLEQIHYRFGKWSVLTNTCRQLQVILTRVQTGSKTNIIDVKYDGLDYKYMNYWAMTGAELDGFGALFSIEDRASFHKMDIVNTRLKKAIKYRPYKVDIVNKTNNSTLSCSLAFPEERLEIDFITQDMVLDNIVGMPESDHKRIRIGR